MADSSSHLRERQCGDMVLTHRTITTITNHIVAVSVDSGKRMPVNVVFAVTLGTRQR